MGHRGQSGGSGLHRSLGELPRPRGVGMSHDHGHEEGADHPDAPSEVEARTLALESLLIEKGILTSEDVDRVISTYEHGIGPMTWAHLVARAWLDPSYRERLLRLGA